MQGTQKDVQELILEPMAALYRAPGHIEATEVALQQYAQALVGKFDRAAMRAGWAKLIAEYDRRDWPTVKQVLRFCWDASRELSGQDARAAPGAPAGGWGVGNNAWCNDERITDQVMRSEFGALSVQEGCAHALHEHARRYGRGPDTVSEFYRLRDGWLHTVAGMRADIAAAPAAERAPGPGKLGGQMAGVMERMLTRALDHEAELARTYGGGG